MTAELTERMKLRIEALVAQIDAFLPGFCEGMEGCDNCSLRNHKYYSNCLWLETLANIEELEYIRRSKIECGEPDNPQKTANNNPELIKQKSRFDDII